MPKKKIMPLIYVPRSNTFFNGNISNLFYSITKTFLHILKCKQTHLEVNVVLQFNSTFIFIQKAGKILYDFSFIW